MRAKGRCEVESEKLLFCWGSFQGIGSSKPSSQMIFVDFFFPPACHDAAVSHLAAAMACLSPHAHARVNTMW